MMRVKFNETAERVFHGALLCARRSIRLQFSPTLATGGLAVEFPKVLTGGIMIMFFGM